jgi:hypothetical protein
MEQDNDDDDNAIIRFVQTNPYPSYEEMMERIDCRVDLFAEYGSKNHVCCKIIYENPTNKELIVEMGKAIYKMGGLQALSKNHEIIKCFSPYKTLVQGRIIEEYFEGVCAEWKS